jgi:hypothetical protein
VRQAILPAGFVGQAILPAAAFQAALVLLSIPSCARDFMGQDFVAQVVNLRRIVNPPARRAS